MARRSEKEIETRDEVPGVGGREVVISASSGGLGEVQIKGVSAGTKPPDPPVLASRMQYQVRIYGGSQSLGTGTA